MQNDQIPRQEAIEALRPLIHWLGAGDRRTVDSLKSMMRMHPHIKTPAGLLDEADDSYIVTDEVADIIWLTLNS